jgi:hypothetical protein
MQELARLPSGKHLVAIDPHAQHVIISGTRDLLVLSFEDAHMLLDVLSCHRDLFYQALYAHLAPLPDWVHEGITDELREQIGGDEARPEYELEQRAAHSSPQSQAAQP